mmetsp:Transcript_43395/g.77955  ORF Transcript_43395/g.77955 Transcript_43395/m.77955 type:complete len:82 (+) Transcript_43395:107-352(+)
MEGDSAMFAPEVDNRKRQGKTDWSPMNPTETSGNGSMEAEAGAQMMYAFFTHANAESQQREMYEAKTWQMIKKQKTARNTK